MQDLNKMLEDQVKQSLEGLNALSGEARKEKLEEITKLHKLYLDETKRSDEYELRSRDLYLKSDEKDFEIETSKRGTKEDRIFKIADRVLTFAGIAVPALIYAVFLNDGFKFEQENIYTSKTFLDLLGKLRPTKK